MTNSETCELLREARSLAEAALGKLPKAHDGSAYFFSDQPEADRLKRFIRRVDAILDGRGSD